MLKIWVKKGGKMDRDLRVDFCDLESNGTIKMLRSKKWPGRVDLVEQVKCDVDKISVPGKSSNLIVKRAIAPKGLLSIASSKIYKRAGIQTPEVYGIGTCDRRLVNTIQEDVSNINGLEIILPYNDVDFKKINKKVFGKYKWQIFYDRNLENTFLQFMTPECLEQLKEVFLADELRTDIDRHIKNYFFYKEKGSDKYQGIIVIDLDQMIIYNYCMCHPENFEAFVNYNYPSSTPQMADDSVCYRQRVRDIMELIQDGVLSDRNIEMMKTLLQEDFAQEIKMACKQQGLSRKQRNEAALPVEMLWDYNRETVGRELGL